MDSRKKQVDRGVRNMFSGTDARNHRIIIYSQAQIYVIYVPVLVVQHQL